MLKAVLSIALPIVAAAAFFGRNAANISSHVPSERPAVGNEVRPAGTPARSATAFELRGCRRGEELIIAADREGHFQVHVDFGGRTVPMMIDTGATRVILPHEEAVRLALPLEHAQRVPVNTANGLVSASLARVERLRFGPICLNNVDVLVMPSGRLPVGLLGMNVIKELARFEMSRARLIMAH